MRQSVLRTGSARPSRGMRGGIHRVRWMLALIALVLAVPVGLGSGSSVVGYCAGAPELQFLKLINNYRADHGLGKLDLGQHIGAAAQHHSKDMAARNYLDHTTLGKRKGPKQRLIAHDYAADKTAWSENIYAGYGVKNGVDLGSAQGAFKWWKASPDHNANMLNPNFVVIGIDRASNSTAKYRNYWTTTFGGARDTAAIRC